MHQDGLGYRAMFKVGLDWPLTLDKTVWHLCHASNISSIPEGT